MKKVAIFVSDLHLGRGDNLEDFSLDNENALVQFLNHQSQKYQDEYIDLVILGDFIDVWQVASDQDKNAAQSINIDIKIDENLEQQKVKQIIGAHPGTFSALRQFIHETPSKRRLFFVTGNHDHSLVHSGVRKPINDAIANGDMELDGCIHFVNYYDEPELRTYAEHGNQYDVNNDYDDFAKYGAESPGYFFVRLFWNRLEPKAPDLDNWTNCFQAIMERKLWSLVLPAFRLFRQYRTDPRPFERIDVPGIPFFGAGEQPVAAPVTGKPLPGSPNILFSDRGDPELIFSTDVATENKLRKLYHDSSSAEFKEAIDEILREKYRGQAPKVPTDLVPSMPEFGLFHDEYITAVTEMFAPEGQSPRTLPVKGRALSADVYDYVLFGHTHEEKKIRLSRFNVTYFNTGTWSMKCGLEGKNQSRLCYVTIQKSHDGEVSAFEDYWKFA